MVVVNIRIDVEDHELRQIDEAAKLFRESRNQFTTKAVLQRAYAVIAQTSSTLYERDKGEEEQ